MLTWLQGKKTYILVVIGVVTLLVKFLSGDISIIQFLGSQEFVELIAILGIGTIRAGISNAANPQ